MVTKYHQCGGEWESATLGKEFHALCLAVESVLSKVYQMADSEGEPLQNTLVSLSGDGWGRLPQVPHPGVGQEEYQVHLQKGLCPMFSARCAHLPFHGSKRPQMMAPRNNLLVAQWHHCITTNPHAADCTVMPAPGTDKPRPTSA